MCTPVYLNLMLISVQEITLLHLMFTFFTGRHTNGFGKYKIKYTHFYILYCHFVCYVCNSFYRGLCFYLPPINHFASVVLAKKI